MERLEAGELLSIKHQNLPNTSITLTQSVFPPHQGQQEITVGNKDVNSLSFIPTEKGDPYGVMTAIVREGSIAYQKGVRTGDYLLEVDGIPITASALSYE